MQERRIAAAVIPIVSLLLAACTAEQRQSFSQLLDVQKAVAAQFPGADVNVNLANSQYLTITVVNSAMNTADESKRQAAAKRAAMTASHTYKQQLKTVRVIFMRHRGGFGFHITNSIASYAFSPAELKGAA